MLLARLGVSNTKELALALYRDFHCKHEEAKMQSAIPVSLSGSLHELASAATSNAIDLCRTHTSAICSTAKKCPQGKISELELSGANDSNITLAVRPMPVKQASMFANYFSAAQVASGNGHKK